MVIPQIEPFIDLFLSSFFMRRRRRLIFCRTYSSRVFFQNFCRHCSSFFFFLVCVTALLLIITIVSKNKFKTDNIINKLIELIALSQRVFSINPS